MSDEVVTKKGVRALTTLSSSHIDRLEKAGRFPRSFKLGAHRNSRRLWWKHEVADFLKSHATKR
jgi:predicted DNA-binding transcriptional regulator AlpA